MQALARLLPHRHPALLVALADDPHLGIRQVNPVRVQPDELADPQATGVEELQDGPIPDADIVVRRRCIEDARHVVGLEHVREIAARTRCIHQSGNVSGGVTLAQGKRVEAANRGRFAGLRAALRPVALEGLDEVEQRLRVIPPSSPLGLLGELGQVAAIGRDGER